MEPDEIEFDITSAWQATPGHDQQSPTNSLDCSISSFSTPESEQSELTMNMKQLHEKLSKARSPRYWNSTSEEHQPVYVIYDQTLEWLMQRRSLASLITLFINGKEANWDMDDKKPFLARCIIDAPAFLRNVICRPHN